jgi:hypothetical protein
MDAVAGAAQQGLAALGLIALSLDGAPEQPGQQAAQRRNTRQLDHRAGALRLPVGEVVLAGHAHQQREPVVGQPAKAHGTFGAVGGLARGVGAEGLAQGHGLGQFRWDDLAANGAGGLDRAGRMPRHQTEVDIPQRHDATGPQPDRAEQLLKVFQVHGGNHHAAKPAIR